MTSEKPPGRNQTLRQIVHTSINALARFERNALAQPGVTHIIVLEGINDIGNARQNPTPPRASRSSLSPISFGCGYRATARS